MPTPTVPLHRFQTDFARLRPGDWFLPMTLKGVDQHALLSSAVETQSISGFTYEAGHTPPPTQLPHFQVPDLREFLFAQAETRRSDLRAASAVITGSAGKTSVKELLGAILRACPDMSFHISPDNQNTKIALATQILRLPAGCTRAVFEMGARRLGDFVVPLRYLQPSVVALLNIGSAHVGEFGSPENLLREKLSALEAPTAQALVVPADDPRILAAALKTGKRVVTFGSGESTSDISFRHIGVLSEAQSSIEIDVSGEVRTFDLSYQTPGRAMNVTAAIAIALELGLPLEAIAKGLSSFTGVSRRFERIDWNGTPSIDDAFNASPESMKAGLSRLNEAYRDRKILLVLGSMLELGSSSTAAHQKIGRHICELFKDSIERDHIRLATIGSEAREIVTEAIRCGFPPDRVDSFHDATEARSPLFAIKSEFDVVYFKASKSMRLQDIFGAR